MTKMRDHGGGLDAAIAQFGGKRTDWVDLSTGINPHPYPVGEFASDTWTALPDHGAFDRLEAAARAFWDVPDEAAILAAPGASALIARIPSLLPAGKVEISTPTYNEHAAGFLAEGWEVVLGGEACVLVHPNNPDGRLWENPDLSRSLTIIDESFCDVTPAQTHIKRASETGVLILKSFGKFWGLAGLRLGFVIGDPILIARLRDTIGPWQVSGPALEIGARALEDFDWASMTRRRLAVETARLDGTMKHHGAKLVGGTTLFRLYEVDDAVTWQDRLARGHVWSRVFPYSKTWLRLGLPPAHGWAKLEAAL